MRKIFKVLNPKPSAELYTPAQVTAVKTYVDNMIATKRHTTFDEIRADVVSVAGMSDGALHTLLVAAGCVVVD